MKGTESYIDAGGDICIGDSILFTENVFSQGSLFSKGKPLGIRVIHAEIVKESYGAKKQQHTFTLRVIESAGFHPLKSGRIYLRKGRNIHRIGCSRAVWSDESARIRILREKHLRGEKARADREKRRTTVSVSAGNYLFD